MSARLLLISENRSENAEVELEAAVRAALGTVPGGLPVGDLRFETLGAASRGAFKSGEWSAPLTQRRGVSARRELRDHLLQEGLAAVIFQIEGDEAAFNRCVVEPIRRDLGALRGVTARLVRWAPDAEGGGTFHDAAHRLRAVPGLTGEAT